MRFTQAAVCLAPLFLCGALGSNADANVAGTITQLSTGSAASTQTAPAISRGNVVWTDTAQLGGGATNADIFFLDLAGGPARNLTNTPGEQEYLEDIDGGNVVFTHTSPAMPGDILVYDTSLGSSTTIASSDALVRYAQPAVRGNYVVYIRFIGAQPDVDGYDLALGAPLSQITNDAALQLHPRVSDDLVVFEDYGSGSADIMGYRIGGGGLPFAIASGPNAQLTPDVDGDWVVWVETIAPGNDQIVAWNAATNAQRTLTTVASNKVQPRISGNQVVWADDRAGNLDIRSYDLATNVEDVLVDGPGDQMLSALDGNRVVYTSNQTGFEQIYLFTTTAPPPSDLPPGCDPALTDLVGASTHVTKVGRKPEVERGQFDAVKGRRYFLCVENGLPNGTQRTFQVVAAADQRIVLTPANFRPHNDPPRWVAARLPTAGDDDLRHGMAPGRHRWQLAAAGPGPATLNVSVRVAK